MKNTFRYIITDVVSIPVCRMTGKGEAYKYATKPGCGVVEWYSAINDYKSPVNRDTSDKTQQLVCDNDSSAVLYPRYGRDFCIFPYDDINIKEIPRQAEVDAIVISDDCGFSFWENEVGDVKIFVTYDETGLIDTYRLEGWNDKPYDGETEITFNDLQSEQDYDTISRADIIGTFEHSRR